MELGCWFASKSLFHYGGSYSKKKNLFKGNSVLNRFDFFLEIVHIMIFITEFEFEVYFSKSKIADPSGHRRDEKCIDM